MRLSAISRKEDCDTLPATGNILNTEPRCGFDERNQLVELRAGRPRRERRPQRMNQLPALALCCVFETADDLAEAVVRQALLGLQLGGEPPDQIDRTRIVERVAYVVGVLDRIGERSRQS